MDSNHGDMLNVTVSNTVLKCFNKHWFTSQAMCRQRWDSKQSTISSSTVNFKKSPDGRPRLFCQQRLLHNWQVSKHSSPGWWGRGGAGSFLEVNKNSRQKNQYSGLILKNSAFFIFSYFHIYFIFSLKDGWSCHNHGFTTNFLLFILGNPCFLLTAPKNSRTKFSKLKENTQNSRIRQISV